ncbi:putative beta-glucosidase G [Lachnellula suecica]|uniref:beta-glucosidase n=1 Tax=Lachnellula suecica TaxID=602035 RepID=A0A8T9C515_9HELO|nr:putative beta-glucosidase G [Lachnellula suecica]
MRLLYSLSLCVALLGLQLLALFKAFTSGFQLSLGGMSMSSSTSPEPIDFNHDDAVKKANEFVAKLNLTEKAMMVTGDPTSGNCTGNLAPIERVGFSGMCVSDGPAAVNPGDLVSIFPAGITAAATWDRDLMYQRAFALGSEFKGKGVNIALAPVGAALGRHPLAGVNWEGFGPDPYLCGTAMAQTISGMQSAGVQTASKHFIGSEQETLRYTISSNIDDRTLHELYLWPFTEGIKAGGSGIICSYNRINQTHSCENSDLLNRVLKGQLGFEGFVMSDFFGTHSGVKSLNAGLDVTMPGPMYATAKESYFGDNVVEATINGSMSMDRLDDMVCRMMIQYYLLGQDEDYPEPDPTLGCLQRCNLSLDTDCGSYQVCNTPARDVRADHAALIRKVGAAATILLKNIDSALPLKSPMNIGVFGNDAADIADGLAVPQPLPEEGYDIGTMLVGGGPGGGRPSYVVSPLEAIKARAKETGARVQPITNNAVLARNDFHSVYPQPDVCIVFLKSYGAEDQDRTSFELPWNSTLVVNNVASHCPNTVVVMHSEGVNTMPWAQNPNVTAILSAHYPGQETGNSIIDVLWGEVNPSAKLPYTVPFEGSDYHIPIVEADLSDNPQSDFTEGLMTDYRHFDSKDITPLYEFGYGLSYTTFELTGRLSVTKSSGSTQAFPDSSRGIAPGGNPDLYTELLNVKTTVSNTGRVPGATVVQLYLSFPRDSVPEGTPVRVLRGFDKVYLEVGEKRSVTMKLTRRELSFWDTVSQDWLLPEGEFNISVGFSSRDLVVNETVTFRPEVGAEAKDLR